MSDIYRIAVRLTMESNAPAFLSALARQFLHVHAHVRDLEGGLLRLSRIKLAVGGGLAIAGGTAMLTGLKTLTEQAKELSHELTSVSNMKVGIGGAYLAAQADAVARRTTTQVPGTTEAANVRLFGESYSMFGAKNAAAINPMLSTFGQAIGGVTGDYHGAENGLYAMIRSGDLLGKFVNEKTRLIDTENLGGYLNTASRIIAATHGKVGTDTFMAMAQQGGPALANMSEDGLMSMAMVAQGMGGFRSGTAMSSLKQQMVGGTMSKAVAEELEGMGLINGFTYKDKKVRLSDKDRDTDFVKAINSDPLKAADVLQKAMEKHGKTDIESQTNALYTLFGRQTTQRIISDMLRNLPQMMAERGRIQGAEGYDAQAANRNENDYITVEHNMQAAWTNLMQAIAGPQSTVAIDMMKRITGGLDSLTQAVRGMNPATLEALAYGVGALGAAMVGGGVAMLVAAIGPAGWLVLGVGALAGAFKAFAPAQFDQYVAGLKKLGDGLLHLDFGKVASGIAEEAKAIWAALPSKVTGSITGAIDAIAAAFRTAIAGLVAGVSGAISTLGGLFKGIGGPATAPTGRDGVAPGAGGGRYHPSADIIRGATPPARTTTAALHTHVHLDGREIAQSVTKHQVAATEFPNAIGGHDSYGSYYPSGATAMPS